MFLKFVRTKDMSVSGVILDRHYFPLSFTARVGQATSMLTSPLAAIFWVICRTNFKSRSVFMSSRTKSSIEAA